MIHSLQWLPSNYFLFSNLKSSVYSSTWGSPSQSLVVKDPPTVKELQETQVRFLGGEDLLQKGVAIHARILQSTPVFLPGEFHEQKSLGGYSPEGHKESTGLKRLSMQTYPLPSSFRDLLLHFSYNDVIRCKLPKLYLFHLKFS